MDRIKRMTPKQRRREHRRQIQTRGEKMSKTKVFGQVTEGRLTMNTDCYAVDGIIRVSPGNSEWDRRRGGPSSDRP